MATFGIGSGSGVRSTDFDDSSDTEMSQESGECTPSPDVICDGEQSAVPDKILPCQSVDYHGKDEAEVPNVILPPQETITLKTHTSMIELVEIDESSTASESQDSSVQVIEDDESDFFVLDTTGVDDCAVIRSSSPLIEADEEATEGKKKSKGSCRTPKNERDVLDLSKVLTSAEILSPSSEKKDIFKMSCFNCGGEHLLDKCDLPHDVRRIQKNKADHYNNKRKMTERYTDAGKEASNFKPGQISWELRDALGIGPTEIPEWIYRMRKMGFINGYPPAYLKMAVDTVGGPDSVLEFHMESEPSEVNKREGAKKQRSNMGPRINPDKVIFYAGFNFYDRSLRDRERDQFRVPSFKDFIDIHQRELNNNFKREQTEAARSSGQKRRKENKAVHKKRNRTVFHDSDGEVANVEMEGREDNASPILPRPPAPPEISSPNVATAIESGSVSESPENSSNGYSNDSMMTPTVSRTKSSPALLGSSTSISCGTPHGIGARSKMRQKPALENFKDGIVPFRAEEEITAHRGFFRDFMSKIRQKK